MNFESPSAEELAELRADPLLFEQPLDPKLNVAQALEKSLGFRVDRRYWRAQSGHMYGIDLRDFGRGHPSMAMVYAFWPAFETRPLSDEDVDEDLAEKCMSVAEICDDMEPEIVSTVLDFARAARAEGDEYRLSLQLTRERFVVNPFQLRMS